MTKIKIAVVGYGNVGKYTVDAVQAAKDMELVGIIRRADASSMNNIPVVTSPDQLPKFDVAILCSPSRNVPEVAKFYAQKGINTVDSFDIHGEPLWKHCSELDAICKQNNSTSIISAGWDPGSDSVIRTLFQALAPNGVTYTNFGPGMSMGHSVVARSKAGVKDALSMTLPAGAGVHRRMVYVELETGADFNTVADAIKQDDYFKHDETHVQQVPCVQDIVDMGHGVLMERKAASGSTQNQRFRFEMSINNPALTAQIMVCAARATMRQAPGAYVLPEIPPFFLLPDTDRQTLIKTLI